MTREEAIKIIRDTYHTDTEFEALKVLIPEIQESEDERIRKAIVTLIEKLQRYSTNYAGVDPTDMLAYLEKQKEQPQEELVYRMNGLMQEYIKEGEDDAEKEHRLKCYQLFWDALEDADFFEQKEQKPAEWSEEDEDNLCRVIKVLEDNDSDWKELSNWLQSLRSRLFQKLK